MSNVLPHVSLTVKHFIGIVTIVILLSNQHYATGLPASKSKKSSDTFDLIILHNNDMHARFEETGTYSDKCQPDDARQGKCFGGFARTAHVIQKFRNESAKGGPPVIYLNAGDTFTGTPWFKVYEEQIIIDFLNALKPDAMCLGNHEFDLKLRGLKSLLNGVNFPVVTANLDLNKEPELAQIKSLKNYTILTVNGVQIGIVGYLTRDTKFLAQTGSVEILDEVASINKVTEELKKQGITIIIALGHSGFDMDKIVARDCPDVDAVVGGHTNTFLYNGQSPSIENIQGPYPIVITQKNGKKVPVVQAYAYTKYMGVLQLTFDNKGNLRTFSGQPLLLDKKVPHDPAVLELLEKYRPGVEDLLNTVVGRTAVLLDGDCRFRECNFGNLVTDAMIYGNGLMYNEKDRWTDASVAFMQSGGIRSSVSRGNVTLYDLATAFPFDSTYIVKINLTGDEILKALEHSVHRYSITDGQGEFLQMAGMHVVYNLSRPTGSRVKSAQILCSDCSVPIFEALDISKLYTVLINSFLYTGGDGFDMFQKPDSISLEITDFDIISNYIKAMSTVYPAIEWRVKLEGQVNDDDGGGASQVAVSFAAICLSVLITLWRCDF